MDKYPFDGEQIVIDAIPDENGDGVTRYNIRVSPTLHAILTSEEDHWETDPDTEWEVIAYDVADGGGTTGAKGDVKCP